MGRDKRKICSRWMEDWKISVMGRDHNDVEVY